VALLCVDGFVEFNICFLNLQNLACPLNSVISQLHRISILDFLLRKCFVCIYCGFDFLFFLYYGFSNMAYMLFL
jgi:hypothetical protein